MKPYKSQVDAVSAALVAQRGTICMPTGTGKSVAMALLVNELQLRTLIIVPNLELKRQLTESFTNFFGDEAIKSNITIDNISSRKLHKEASYDVLIIDEAHHVASRTYRELNKTAWKNIYYRFFFTATPFRSKEEEQLLYESIAGQVIYRLSHQTAVAANYIVPMEAYFVECPKTAVEGSRWPSVYSQLVVHNEWRNNAIAGLLRAFKAEGKSTLCLVKEIEHGNILSELAGVHFANGESKDTPDLIKFFSQGKLKTLVSTTGICGEGVDTKAAEIVIIAGLGKSKNAFMQQCGRSFRKFEGKESCKVIIFLDKSHKWTHGHFKEQVKILKEEYSVVPTIIKLD